MKPKKTNLANLENKRGIFLQLGLLITLFLVILAFEWESRPGINNAQGIYIEDAGFDEEFFVVLEKKIEPRIILKPQVADIINIINNDELPDDEYLGQDVEVEPDQGIEIQVPLQDENVDDTYQLFQLHEHPSFQGQGVEGFRIWVMKNLNYPDFAAESGISGKVYIEFTVNQRGYVQDIKVVRGVHPSLDQEVVRMVATSPQWKPGIRGIQNVNVRFTIPISFVLQ